MAYICDSWKSIQRRRAQGTQTVTDSSRSERLFLVLNHPKLLLTPPETRRQCSCAPRFPRIFLSFHPSDLTFWPKHISSVFVFFLGSTNEGTASSANGSIAFQHFPDKPQPDGPDPGRENVKPAQSCVSTDDSFFLFEGALNSAAIYSPQMSRSISMHDVQTWSGKAKDIHLKILPDPVWLCDAFVSCVSFVFGLQSSL